MATATLYPQGYDLTVLTDGKAITTTDEEEGRFPCLNVTKSRNPSIGFHFPTSQYISRVDITVAGDLFG